MEPQFNPYSAPVSDAPPLEHTELPLPASLGQRFVNLLVDTIAISGLGFVSGVVVALVGNPADDASLNFLTYVVSFLYFTLSEGLTGRTLGKLVTGTKVITLDGRRPGFGAVAVRSLCRFIPFEPLSVLFRDGAGWHDTIPNTQVVRAR